MVSRFSCWKRVRIEALFVAGVGVLETARHLKRDPSTICREFKRAGGGFYDAARAQAAADEWAARPKVATLVADPVLGEAVKQRLARRWSPQALLLRTGLLIWLQQCAI